MKKTNQSNLETIQVPPSVAHFARYIQSDGIQSFADALTEMMLRAVLAHIKQGDEEPDFNEMFDDCMHLRFYLMCIVKEQER